MGGPEGRSHQSMQSIGVVKQSCLLADISMRLCKQLINKLCYIVRCWSLRVSMEHGVAFLHHDSASMKVSSLPVESVRTILSCLLDLSLSLAFVCVVESGCVLEAATVDCAGCFGLSC